MNTRLKGKVVVVTGSTGGIGEGIARRMAGDGAAVIVSGRSVARGEQVAREITTGDGQAIFVQTDVTHESDCAHLIQAALDAFGRLDVLVNNAADLGSVPFDDLTTEVWDRVFAVNARGPYLCCRHAIPPMRQQGGGAIINIGTTMVYRGIGPRMDRLAYACSKGSLLAMTKALARALLTDQIRVNWVTVGWVATPGELTLRDKTHGDGAAYLQERAREAPFGRLETVEEIAAGVAYLASDEASHITGCELNISGGLWI
jgi:NAD(P)-dependent dehydrogenase (short-subunit alcohol dehydrogenase family)